MGGEPHPLEAPEILVKEPDEIARFQFDFADSQQLNPSEKLDTIVSTSISPSEEQHELAFSLLTGGPLIAGEQLTDSTGGVVAVAFESTATTSSKVGLFLAPGAQLTSGEELTGQDSGAVVTLAETNGVATKIGETPTVQGTQIADKLLELTLKDGCRPLAGAPWREYVVRVLVRTTLGQDLAGIGRLRIPEAAEAGNAR